MYEIPSRVDLRKCIINAATVIDRAPPILVTHGGDRQLTEDRELAEEPA